MNIILKFIIKNFFDALAIGLSSISLYMAWQFNKKMTQPKIQVNLNYNKDTCEHDFDFTIKNISDFNLYDFKISTKNLDKLKEIANRDSINHDMGRIYDRILNTTIPIFTINQSYETIIYGLSVSGVEYLEIDVEYKLKKDSKKVYTETYKFNILNCLGLHNKTTMTTKTIK